MDTDRRLRQFDSLRERRKELRAGRIETEGGVRGFVFVPQDGAPRALLPHLFGRNHVAGARLTPLNEGLAPYFSTEQGVLVTAVVEGTPAEEAGLEAGDVLLAVSGRPVESVAAVRTLLSGSRRGAAVRVLRRDQVVELSLPGPDGD